MLQILSALAEITAMLVWIVFIFTVAGAWKNLQLWSQCCLADWLDSWLNFVMAACVFNVTYIGNACSSSPSYSWRKRLALTHIRPPVMSSLLSLISPLVLILFLSLSFLCHWLKSEHKLCSTEGTALCSATGKRGIPLGFQSRMCLSFSSFFLKQSCINREVLFLKSLCASGEKNVFIVLNFVRIDEGSSTITD